MRKIQFIMLFIFCAMLFGGAVATAMIPDKEYSDMENRELAQRPAFSIKEFMKGKYQTKYEDYLSDQFVLRDKWVDFSSNLQAAVGQKDINGVYIGKENYLIEKNEEADFDANQVEENVENLSFFLNEMAEVYGKEHVSCIMVPSKAEALPDKLPDFTEISAHEDVLALLKSRLSDGEMLVDVKKILQSHQQEYIYYRTDHHWTTLGAYYVCQAWAEQTGQATPEPLEHYERETVFTDFYGTTYNKAHVKVAADSVELFHTPSEEGIHVSMDDGETEADSMYFPKKALDGFNRYNVFFSKNTFKIDVTTQAKTGKTLLLIKDSFANCFVPFLTEDYERIIMIDYRYGKTSVGEIQSEYEDITDILVLFNTEKFMQHTKLSKLTDTRREKSETMEEFNLEDFLE